MQKNPRDTRLHPLFKAGIFIFVVIIFFILYNSFLVDRNIESLDFSLSNVALAETVGSGSYIAPLIQLQYISELSASNVDVKNLMALEYSSDTFIIGSPERETGDVSSLLGEVLKNQELKRTPMLRYVDGLSTFFKRLFRKLLLKKETTLPNIEPHILDRINSYENSGELEAAIKVYKDTIAQFSGYAQTPTLILRVGYLLHKLGRIDEAKEFYQQLISRFPRSVEAKGAKELLEKLNKADTLKRDAEKIASKINAEQDKDKQQKLYYELGLLNLAASNLKDAIENFIKALSVFPENDIACESYLRLGICQRLLGNLDAAMSSLEKLLSTTTDPKLKTQAEFQMAQVYRQKKDYKTYASLLNNIAKESKDKTITPIVLFQLGSTYLFDLKEHSKAKETFEELRLYYPDNTLAYPGTDFADEYLELYVPPKMPVEVAKLNEESWLEKIMPQQILNLIDNAALRFATRVTEGVREILLLEEYDTESGDYETIELTQKRLNGYLEKWFPVGNKGRVWDVSMEFEGDKMLKVFGVIHLPDETKIKGSIDGKFIMTKIMDKPYWQREGGPTNFVIYNARASYIEKIPVPSAIMNIIIKRSIKHFNKKFPLDIKEFKLDKETILFAGPAREDFRQEMEAEALGQRHMEVKEEDSGFIYGTRKEDLEGGGLSY